MFRRAFLTAAPATLAGCGLAPSGPSTDSYPESPPNILTAFTWQSETVDVSFERGSRLTPDNTGALAVRSTEPDERTVWLDADGEAAAAFPLAPGATVRHPIGAGTEVQVVWTAPDRNRSAVVGRSVRPAVREAP